MKKLALLAAALVAGGGFTNNATAQQQQRPRENAPRDERPAEGQRPPRGDFRPGEAQQPQRGEARRDDAPRGEQRGDSRPGEDQRGQPGQPGQPGQQFNPQELFRDLNDDQRNALRGYLEAQQGVMRETGERSMRLRREITQASMADKPNEGLIRDKIMEAAKLEAESTIARARAFSQVREKLPKETVERLRTMMSNMGPRPGMQGGQGGQGGGREGGDVRRPAGDNLNQPGRGAPDGQRRPDAQREGDQLRKPAGEGDRRPAEGDLRKPAGPRDGDQIRKPGEGDRGPRPDGDRGVRPDGDRDRNPEGGDRKPELPRRPPVDR